MSRAEKSRLVFCFILLSLPGNLKSFLHESQKILSLFTELFTSPANAPVNKFLAFSRNFLDYFVKDHGVIETYDPQEYNLDNVNQGKNLFTLYDLTGEQRYRDAIETIRSQLETQPRTKEGNFWHKKIYPNQVWLDGTYMAQPFYMEYETRCNGMHGCIDSYKQFMNIQKHMKDPKTGLYYHGYDESREMYWADPETGCSANFWLRAMGWFLVAMVDVLERMDDMLYYEYRAIMSMLKDLSLIHI